MSNFDGGLFLALTVAGIGYASIGVLGIVTGQKALAGAALYVGTPVVAFFITKDISTAQHAADQAVANAEHFAKQAEYFSQVAAQSAQSSQAGANYVKGLIDQMSTS